MHGNCETIFSLNFGKHNHDNLIHIEIRINLKQTCIIKFDQIFETYYEKLKK